MLSPLLSEIQERPLVLACFAAALAAAATRLLQVALGRWSRLVRLEHRLAEAPLRHDQLSGCRLGGYRLLRLIGQGGMASVYVAVGEGTLGPERVAIKVLALATSGYQSEVQALLKLRHRHIVRLDDWGEFGGFCYLVLEYVDGPTLRNYVAPSHRHMALLLTQVYEAVQAAHEHSIIHSDLKPENILVDPAGEVRVSDFGLACFHRRQPGQQGGTLAYLAPERLRGAPSSFASDQYALGRLTLELLPTLVEIRPICARMMAERPQDRFASVAEAAQALEFCWRRESLPGS